jgi:arylsulfatase A-like enzyme
MKMPSRFVLFLVLLLATAQVVGAPAPARSPAPSPRLPNVVLIYADDLGYGDVGCYGAAKVRTPHVDALAARGLRFTDAHSAAATCTPSRYALLTGEYAWRRRGTGILPGDAALIIDANRPTLPAILKRAGYATAVVGKWHLGLGPGPGKTDWNGDISPGPLELGFDHAFIMPATGDRVPCVYVQDRRVVGLDPADPIRVSYRGKLDGPIGRDNPELLKLKTTEGHADTIVNGIGRIGFMTGGRAALWKDEDMADVFTRRSIDFIERNQTKPFFLYLATHDVHVPRVPHPRFAGTSACGVRGDVIQQFDACVGEVLAALDRLKLTDDTLVIFTSDNGPVVDDGYADGAVQSLGDHRPAGPWRGGKYTPFEGGTRVPFIVHWPRRVRPGASDTLVSQVDLLASLAALANQDLPAEAGPDSFNVLPALLGEAGARGRETLIEQGGGVAVAVRKGPWKLIPGNPGPQAFNLAADPGETKNVAADHPDVVTELRSALREARERGRTRVLK